MHATTRTAAVLLAGALALAGCSKQEPEIAFNDQVPAALRTEASSAEGEGGGEDAGQTLEFVAIDIDYSQAPTEAAAGPASFSLANEGAILHNVVLEEPGDVVVVEAPGGGTETGTFTLEPGEYTFYCNVPGHRAAGMEGTLAVS